MWVDVKEKLPAHNSVVIVRLASGDIGVGEYSKDFHFSAESSAYDIYCDDDSGLQITLHGTVTHWMEIPPIPVVTTDLNKG